MRKPLVWAPCLAVAFGLSAAAAPVVAQDVSGYVGAEVRGFAHEPLSSVQRRHSASLVAQPEFYFEWADGQQSFQFVPFARLDSADTDRTHVDIREALWQYVGDEWELRAGLGKVFWGVTESRHLVDVINQTDLVENLDGEDKLGQPMVNLTLVRDSGALDLFVLPGFRERSFPGRRGRLRTFPRVDADGATYESSAEQRHVDLAARWSHYVGVWDIGVSHFWGTSREPEFDAAVLPGGEVVLRPRYDIIHQTGLDLQATVGNWLWKLEAIRRSGQGDTFHALTGGFEYTFVGVGGSDADLGTLVEYHYDERGDARRAPFEDDLFVGFRLALNDADSTEVLAGVIHDREGDGDSFAIEASRRFGDRWKLEVEARAWRGIKSTDPLFNIRQDDHIQITLLRYF